MYDFCFLFFLFITFSIVGWITECISCSFWYHRFVHDRGFLIGPYCPVYGLGAVFIYYFLSNFDSNVFLLFIMSMVSTSLLEYLTSVWMEKMFKARWWDYSKEPLNINGRVCLKNSILFGICGVLFTYYIKPFYLDLVDKIPSNTFIIITWILIIIFTIDCIVSFMAMSKLKHNLVNIRHDSTSEIDKEVKEILSSYTFYVKRLFKSFPNVKFSFPTGSLVVDNIRSTLKTTEEIRKERKKKLREIKKEIKESE